MTNKTVAEQDGSNERPGLLLTHQYYSVICIIIYNNSYVKDQIVITFLNNYGIYKLSQFFPKKLNNFTMGLVA